MTELPEDVIDEAERLTRLARDAVDEDEAAAYRRDREQRVAEHGYAVRIREEDDTLVCYPDEWVDGDGVVQPDRIEDVDRGVERSLSGPGEADDWDAVETYNRDLADAVADEYDNPHSETAQALADFASNHYAKPIDALTDEELTEFREEYFPRNAWPSDAQQEALSLSIEYTLEKADEKRLD